MGGDTANLIFADGPVAAARREEPGAAEAVSSLAEAEARSEAARAEATAAEARASAARRAAAQALEAARRAEREASEARARAAKAIAAAASAKSESVRLGPAVPLAVSGESRQSSPGENAAGVPVPKGFQLIRLLGQSEVGEVYLARQLSMDRLVRIELLHPQLCGNMAFTARFVREARTAGRFSHPALMRVYEADSFGGRYYCVTENVEGQSLAELVQTGGTLAPSRARDLALSLAAGLEQWAQAGLVHGGVGPARVACTRSGEFKLTGLGLAVRGIDLIAELPEGTINYVAPEMVFSENVDFRADVYSLGATLFFALSGRAPHAASSPGETVRMARAGMTSPPQLTGVPLAMSAVIDRAMKPSPAARYQDFAALSAALQAALPDRKTPGTITLPKRVADRRAR